MTRYPCPCCRYRTLQEPPPGTFALCPVCWWEDDDVQARLPDVAGGANVVSLRQARANFEAFGASDEKFLDKVRRPLPDEGGGQ